MRLKEKVAVITGAAEGIGRATAIRFAEEGARVALCDINVGAGQSAESEVKKYSPSSMFIQLDVTDRKQINAVVAKVTEAFGRIDVLVNNAGIIADAQLPKMSESQWDRVIEVNLKGTFECTQAVAPVMIKQESGRILNAASIVALYGNFGQSNYVAAKSGVIGMTRVWARELGRKSICVNAVAPGVHRYRNDQASAIRSESSGHRKDPLAAHGHTPGSRQRVCVSGIG